MVSAKHQTRTVDDDRISMGWLSRQPRVPFRVPVRPLATDAESLEGLDHRMQGEPPLFSSEGDEYGQREITL